MKTSTRGSNSYFGPRVVASGRAIFRSAIFRNSKLRRAIGGLLGVFALVGLGLWAFDDGPEPLPLPQNESPLRVENLRSFKVRRDGKPLWEIAAKSVVVAPDGATTTARGISRGVLFREGKPFLQLGAAQIRLENQTNNLDASGGVWARGPERFAFQTPRAKWLAGQNRVEIPEKVAAQLRDWHFQTPRLFYGWDKGTLSAPQTVEIWSQGVVLRASSLKASTKTRILTLGGGAELIFDPKTAKVAVPDAFSSLANASPQTGQTSGAPKSQN